MPKHEALFVRYCAKDFLDGTQSLTPMEELAYRRICDLIYDSGDRLRDDDKRLAWLTKTGKKWPEIKMVLVGASGSASGKLYIDQGFIRNLRCSKEIAYVTEKRKAAALGGKATAESGKSLENLKQAPKHPPKQAPKHPPEASPEPATEVNHLTTKPKNPPKVPSSMGLEGETDKPPKPRVKPRDRGTNPRAKGTNLRANGANPRASGTNPRNGQERPYTPDPSALPPVEPWDMRIKHFRNSGFWMQTWGPKPDEPGCYAPAAMLRPP